MQKTTLPITAYHPQWFMHYAHMNIPEAIRAIGDLRATCFVPTQWGTFHFKEQYLNQERFLLFNLGKMVPPL